MNAIVNLQNNLNNLFYRAWQEKTRQRRRFKEHKIDGKTMELTLQNVILTETNSSSKIFRNILKNFVISLKRLLCL